MAIFTYTKKLIADYLTVEGRAAHEHQGEVYQDWYFDQIDNGLADDTIGYAPYEWVSDTVIEVLLTDQTQAESLLALCNTIAADVGFPVVGNIVDYTE